MPSGIIRQINGEIAHTKSKGKKFLKELGESFSQSKIAKAMPKTQVLKNKKHK